MKTLIIIPARYGSTRFPSKMLKNATGWPLVRHVYEQATQSEADRVIIATDDQRILDAVKNFGGEAILTKDTHQSGTDRIAEVVSKVKGYEVIVNLQGDEPEIEPSAINQLIYLQKQYQPFMSTLCCPFPENNKNGHGSPLDPSCVKVVLGKKMGKKPEMASQALYFSRSIIPYPRATNNIIEHPENYYLHVGMYASSPESIVEFAALPHSFLENTERLEQLRVIENGHVILVGTIPHSFPGIDTEKDYLAFVKRHHAKKSFNKR